MLAQLISPVTGLLDKFIEDKDQKAACFAGIKNVGLPYLVQEFPSHKIIDIKCVYWDVSDKVGI